jgi:FixJ family two-component response regulator
MHRTAGLVAVVEDDAAMRKSIERLLQANGYTPVVFITAHDDEATRREA